MPEKVISDRDVRLTGSFSKESFSQLGCPQLMSTAFHPQSDGQTERMNRVLEEMLRAYVSPQLSDWDQHLGMCQFAINSAYNASIKTTPFEMVYGSNPRIPATIQAGPIPRPVRATGAHAAQVQIARIVESVKHARQCMVQAQQRQKQYADAHRRDLEF